MECNNQNEANNNLTLYVEGTSDKCEKCDKLIYKNGIMTCELLSKEERKEK